MEGPPTVDWTARFIGVFGVLIALAGLLLSYIRGKTRLTVMPDTRSYGASFGDVNTDIVIKVVNRSEFPVTIEEAGIEFVNEGTRPLRFTHTFATDEVTRTAELPITMAARSSVSIVSSEQEGVKSAVILSVTPAKCAYVKTADGYVKRGTSQKLTSRAVQSKSK